MQAVLHELPSGQVHDGGAVILFRKVPHLTAELLKQIVDCHLARNAALGADRESREDCPLTVDPAALRAVAVSVVNQQEGLALTLEVPDEAAGHEILQRSRRAAGQTVSDRDSNLAVH